MSKFHQLKIKSITKETENAVSISFDVPEDLISTFKFKAGQYLILRSTIDGDEIRRDYSLCTNPDNGELKVVVKEVKDGVFSVYANNVLKIGDVLDVAPPNGRFVFEPDVSKSRTIVAFAAGSGITPIMSIAKTVLEQEPQSKFVLVYGNKSPRDTIFLNDLNDMLKHNGDRFKLKLVFSQSNEDNALFGRIEASTVNYVLNEFLNANEIETFYLCGPKPMIQNVTETLIEKGIKKDTIKFELFTVGEELEEVETKHVNQGFTVVTVLVDDEQSSFVMSQSKTILEVALENDIDAPYSCQGGICSSCVARLTDGEVKMRQNNILTDSELEEGLILTCQSQPTTTTVTVDYDDV